MLRTGLIAILLLALLAAASCSGGTATAHYAAFIPTASLDRANSMGADNAQVALVPADGAGTTLELRVTGLEDAKAVYGQVDYDPALVHLTDATATDGSSALSDGTLTASNQIVMIVDQPHKNRVVFGMVLGNWPERKGIDGELTLATLSFAVGPVQIVRSASKAPLGVYNEIDLEAAKDGAGRAVLTWKEALAGDGGNDGLVSIADLTPLGAQLNIPVTNTIGADADYDHNGLPNVSDLSAMGPQLDASLGGYKIMAGPTPTSLSEVDELVRTVVFPTKPPLGEVTWAGTSPAALTANTSYQVVPFENLPAKALGLPSDVESLTGQVTQTISAITDITFDDPDSVVIDAGGGVFQIIVTEESVDGTPGNTDPFSLEHLQLHAIADTVEDPGNPIDVTDSVLWYVTDGGGLASVTTGVGARGDMTFFDRGQVEITAQESGDFNTTKTIIFQLMTIESVTLTGPGASPFATSPGNDVALTVDGLFDSDNDPVSGNEVTLDISLFVTWATLVDVGPEAAFSIDKDATTVSLGTVGTIAGNQVRISAEYPRQGPYLLNDNLSRASPYFQVNIN